MFPMFRVPNNWGRWICEGPRLLTEWYYIRRCDSSFFISIVDVSVGFGSQSNINLVDFMWTNTCVFAFKIYAIDCVPLSTPTVFYLRHYRAASEGWTSVAPWAECSEEIKLLLVRFAGDCTNTFSCRCNVCVRQPRSLRSLASYTVFQLTFNLSEFTLSSRTLYHQYLCAAESGFASDLRLVPIEFTSLYLLLCATNVVKSVNGFTMIV